MRREKHPHAALIEALRASLAEAATSARRNSDGDAALPLEKARGSLNRHSTSLAAKLGDARRLVLQAQEECHDGSPTLALIDQIIGRIDEQLRPPPAD